MNKGESSDLEGTPFEVIERYMSDIHEGEDKAWSVAEEYHRIKNRLPMEVKRKLLEISVKAVLEKAAHILGANKPAAKKKKIDLSERTWGELDVEETLENILGKDIPDPRDIILETKEGRRINIALMMDTSLSMTGRKLAWAGLSAAVLAKKLKLKDMALILFESSASVIKHIEKADSIERLVGRILNAPATGFTNIEDALKKGLYQLSIGTKPEKVGILITDGKYTEGGYPLPWAAKFRKLYVLKTEDYNVDEDLCRKMASQGGGKTFSVTRYEDLPHRLHGILNEILR
jgi:Mg-chelatase subunit ChlD